MQQSERPSSPLRRQLVLRVTLRWGANSFALWLASTLLSGVDHGNSLGAIIAGGLVLSLVNAIVKPIVMILALPAILLTIGLFTLIVNGLMVWIVSVVVDEFTIDSLWWAVLAGLMVSLVNYGLTTYLEERIKF